MRNHGLQAGVAFDFTSQIIPLLAQARNFQIDTGFLGRGCAVALGSK